MTWMDRNFHWVIVGGAVVAGVAIVALSRAFPQPKPNYIPGTYCREFTTETLRCVKCDGTSFATGPVSCVPLKELP